MPLANVQEYLNLAESYFVSFTEEHQNIAGEIEDEAIGRAQDAIFNEIESVYVRLRARLSTRISQLMAPPAEQPHLAVAPQAPFNQAMIGVFSGEATTWRRFHDQFNSLVHNNARIDPIEKFRILTNALRGRAVEVVGAFVNSAEQYSQAWQRMCTFYNDNHAQINAYLREMTTMNPLRPATGAALRQLRARVREIAGQLVALGMPIEQNARTYIFAIERCFDRPTSEAWNARRNNASPTMQIIFEFIEERARELDRAAMAPPGVQQCPPANQKPGEGPIKCLGCGQLGHHVHRCPAFLAMAPADRQEHIRQRRLCANCFRATHPTERCTWGPCHRCPGKKQHNSLLCRAAEMKVRRQSPKIMVRDQRRPIDRNTLAEALNGAHVSGNNGRGKRKSQQQRKKDAIDWPMSDSDDWNTPTVAQAPKDAPRTNQCVPSRIATPPLLPPPAHSQEWAKEIESNPATAPYARQPQIQHAPSCTLKLRFEHEHTATEARQVEHVPSFTVEPTRANASADQENQNDHIGSDATVQAPSTDDGRQVHEGAGAPVPAIQVPIDEPMHIDIEPAGNSTQPPNVQPASTPIDSPMRRLTFEEMYLGIETAKQPLPAQPIGYKAPEQLPPTNTGAFDPTLVITLDEKRMAAIDKANGRALNVPLSSTPSTSGTQSSAPRVLTTETKIACGPNGFEAVMIPVSQPNEEPDQRDVNNVQAEQEIGNVPNGAASSDVPRIETPSINPRDPLGLRNSIEDMLLKSSSDEDEPNAGSQVGTKTPAERASTAASSSTMQSPASDTSRSSRRHRHKSSKSKSTRSRKHK